MGGARLARAAIVLAIASAVVWLFANRFAPGLFRPAVAPEGIAKSEIARIKDAVDTYRITFGKMPESLENLRHPPDGSEPLLDKAPIDSWGRPYVLKRDGNDYDIVSFGADGVPGGTGADADISYEERVRRRADGGN